MKKLYLFFGLFFIISKIFAQTDADLEHTYGSYPGFNGNISTSLLLPNGQLLLGGDFTTYNGVIRNHIISFNDDSTLNTSLNFGQGFNGTVQALAIQADGKIIVGGKFTSYNSVSQKYLIRLNTDGSVDTSFSPIIALTTSQIISFKNIVLQSDGKIIVNITYKDTTGINNISLLRRFNSDGSIDSTFNLDTSLISTPTNTVEIKSIDVQSDDKLLVGWYENNMMSGYVDYGLMRLENNGNKDITFAINHYNTSKIKVLPLDQILIAADSSLYRLNSDGSVDTSFSVYSNMNVFIDNVTALLPLSNGKYILTGGLSSFLVGGNFYNHIMRFNNDGTVDSTFNIGSGFDKTLNTAIVLPTGKIIAGGDFENYNNSLAKYLVKLDINGQIDSVYGEGNGFNQTITTLAIQSDNKVVIGGKFTKYNNLNENKIIRLNTDGSKDTTFNIGTGFNNNVYTTQLQTDGKLLVGGVFDTFNGTPQNNLVRLNSDGSLDNTFQIQKRFNGVVNTVAIQTDGKILAGGFLYPNSAYYDNLKRFNSDGSLDTTFNIGTGFNNTTYSIVMQSDNKILVGGSFTSFNGSTRYRLVRLNSNGTFDSTFLLGNSITTGTVYNIVQQPDGKLLIAGNFHYSNNGVEKDNLIRLNENGTFDTSFNFNYDSIVESKAIALQTDGKIILNVKYYMSGPTIMTGIIRLNSNGSLDTTFNSKNGFFADISSNTFAINALGIQTDGKILAAGNFSNYKTQQTANLVRLNGSSVLADNSHEADIKFMVFPNPTKDVIGISLENGILMTGYAILDISGKNMVTQQLSEDLIDIQNLETGVYFIKIYTTQGILMKRFIKE